MVQTFTKYLEIDYICEFPLVIYIPDILLFIYRKYDYLYIGNMISFRTLFPGLLKDIAN